MIPAKKPYFISAGNKALIESVMARRKSHPVNILIKGKHGLGKSELARQIAANAGMDYVPVPINLLQESGQLMGHDEFTGGETRFVPSSFVQAVKTPNTLVHLEELNRPESPKALGELFPLLDDSRMIRHDKIGEVGVADGVVFVGTLNEGFEYSGIDPLDEALRDRFFMVELSYLPAMQEVNLIMMRTGLMVDKSAELVKFCNSLRNDGQNPIHVSTRRVLMMAELVVSGLPMQEAVIGCVAVDKDKLESILLKFDFGGKVIVGATKESGAGYVLL